MSTFSSKLYSLFPRFLRNILLMMSILPFLLWIDRSSLWHTFSLFPLYFLRRVVGVVHVVFELKRMDELVKVVVGAVLAQVRSICFQPRWLHYTSVLVKTAYTRPLTWLWIRKSIYLSISRLSRLFISALVSPSLLSAEFRLVAALMACWCKRSRTYDISACWNVCLYSVYKN